MASSLEMIWPLLAPITPIIRDDALPLSFAQQRLWFMDQLEPESPAYNVPFAVEVAGPLDVPALEATLREIARRHETLRTTFHARDGRPFCRVAPEPQLDFTIADLRAETGAALDGAVERVIHAEMVAPFDLAAGPLMRVRLVRRADEHTVVVLVVHHIVFDVWSVAVFVRELVGLYPSFARGAPARVAPLPVQYVDFAACQREWMRGAVLDGQLAYWRARLAGELPRVRVPADHAPVGPRSWAGGRGRLEADPDLTERVRALARRDGVSPFMVLLAAYKIALRQRTGIDDVVVGTDVANRNRIETEGMVGFFVNQLVLRTDLGGCDGFRDVLARVAKTSLEAFEHQDVPFDKLVEALQPKRVVGQAPLFDAKFVMRNVHIDRIELEGVAITPVELEPPTTAFDLVLTVADYDGALVFGVEYSREVYRPETIEGFLHDYRAILDHVTRRPDIEVAALDAQLAAARRSGGADAKRREERAAALPNADRGVPASVHGWFAREVDRGRDRVAVQVGGEAVTYGELERRAQQLAWCLVDDGVGRGDRVAIELERSIEAIVAIVATLEAGAAYVPIDPSSPRERARYVLDDACVRAVVTDRDDVPSVPGRLVISPRDRPGRAPHRADPSGRSGVRDLHVGLDRASEGRGCCAPPGGCALRGRRGRVLLRRARHLDGVPLPRVRLLGVGGVRAAALGRPRCPRPL
jgi:hypothetical protein